MSGDIFGYHTSEEGRCYWCLVEKAKDASKHPTTHRYAPTIKNYVVSVEVEKPRNRKIKVALFILL